MSSIIDYGATLLVAASVIYRTDLRPIGSLSSGEKGAEGYYDRFLGDEQLFFVDHAYFFAALVSTTLLGTRSTRAQIVSATRRRQQQHDY